MKKNITIWDLDYYYAKNKKDVYDTDAMKVSSYHKQIGDSVNFVLKEDDINRDYDICYIVKNKTKTPEPPIRFLLDKINVRWIGKAVPRARLKSGWKMTDVILGCRPDYLLYPNLNTVQERSEFIRFFNDKGEKLRWLQDWTNTFKNKMLIVSDTAFWNAKENEIIEALQLLQRSKNVYFSEPILIQKILSNNLIKELFLSLKFSKSAKFNWLPIGNSNMQEAIDFIKIFKNNNKQNYSAALVFDYRLETKESHWDSIEAARKDFHDVQKWILIAKENKMALKIIMPSTRFETPYFELFEALSIWSNDEYSWKTSWLKWITLHYGKTMNSNDALVDYWNSPRQWTEVFRDLLLQTYKYKDFLLTDQGNNKISDVNIPWSLWEKEFRYEI